MKFHGKKRAGRRRRAGEDGGWKPPPGGKAGCRHEDALILQGGDRGRHGLRREAAPGAPQEDQKRSFNANCNWRALPKSPVGKRVEVMTPKVELPGVATRPG